MRHQLEVNLLGTMKITHKLMPLIRKDSARIVVVSSHCASEPLPGVAAYSATKAAINAWATAIRVELKKYGIDVVTFVPGRSHTYFSFLFFFGWEVSFLETNKKRKGGPRSRLTRPFILSFFFLVFYYYYYYHHLLFCFLNLFLFQLQRQQILYSVLCPYLSFYPRLYHSFLFISLFIHFLLAFVYFTLFFGL